MKETPYMVIFFIQFFLSKSLTPHDIIQYRPHKLQNQHETACNVTNTDKLP